MHTCGENMSVDSDDITARTLLKGFLAAEVPKSTVKRQSKRRASELERLCIKNETSLFRNVRNINLLSPSMTLRGRMKEKIRHSINKATGSATRNFPDKGLSGKHLLCLGTLASESDLDKDTPRTILKKLIHTENEVSMLVTERSKDGKHEQTEEEPTVKTNHLGIHNLETHVLESPVHIAASGLSRTRKKKKRISVSQFEREVKETFPQIRENKVSMLVTERSKDGKHEQTEEEPTVKTNHLGIHNLETHVLESPVHIAASGLSRTRKKKKRISVSQFEREVKETFPQIRENEGRLEDHSENTMALANNSAMSRSLKTSFSIPSVPESIEKRGLDRRPKKHRIISVEDFEEGIKRNVMHLKGSQNCFVESMVVSTDGSMLLSNALQTNTEIILSNTELFVLPQPKGQTLQELSQPRSPYLLSISKQSLKSSLVHKGDVVSEELTSTDDLEPKVGIQREVDSKKDIAQLEGVKEESYLNVDSEKALVIEGVEEQNESSGLDVENEVVLMEEEFNSADTTENDVALAKGMTTDLEQRDKNGTKRLVSSISFRKSLHDTEKLVDNVFQRSEDSIDVGSHTLTTFPLLLEEVSGITINKTAGSVLPGPEVGAEAEENNVFSENDRWQEEEDDNKMELPETDQITGNAGSSTGELSMDKNIFLRIKDIKFSPSLPTPHYLKTTSSKFPKKPPFAKHAPMRTNRVLSQMKKEPALPSRLVKQIFAHYAKMSVAKDSFKIVEKCLDVYFKQLSNDLEAFAGHAKRKIVDATDLELLMRRQGLVTNKMPLHVLIERHLPLEYRKLLIPVAMSGNKVIPKK
uniref:Centromere protein T n=1 Tax=Geotrypetes seraphini TaxID=260995 RepID=A0A6P8QLC8_GEOSA|nr:centromere protein T isoform X2 [Geotrypetes seraphini]XP_033797689.1 centromere protein T isoform X2 [Geotrypetes seraphini]XP_033797691.1 centromere protein T isoform X2 [Geotrypetes seraphini]